MGLAFFPHKFLTHSLTCSTRSTLHTHSPSHSHAHSHSHSHSLTLSVSHSPTLLLSLSHSLTLPISLPLPLSLSLSFSHSLTHSRTHSLQRSHFVTGFLRFTIRRGGVLSCYARPGHGWKQSVSIKVVIAREGLRAGGRTAAFSASHTRFRLNHQSFLCATTRSIMNTLSQTSCPELSQGLPTENRVCATSLNCADSLLKLNVNIAFEIAVWNLCF